MRTLLFRLAILGATLVTGAECCAALLSYSYSGPSVAIPDNSGSGTAVAFSLPSSSGNMISSLTVAFDVSGGYNGDLYAYLSHSSGFAVLLNRVGVGATTPGSSASGYANTGFILTLSPTAVNNVHFYQNYAPSYNGAGQLTGSWQPDGRGIDPGSSPASFDAAGTADFGQFTGLDPNGAWTLFLADVSPGAVSTLNFFSVDVTVSPVPEPVNVALGIFGGIAVIVFLYRHARVARNGSRPEGPS